MQKKTIGAEYSEKYTVWRNLLDDSDISAGKGRITIEDNLLQTLWGKMLVLDLSSKKGPCPDDMCQLTMDIAVSIVPEAENSSENAVHKQSFSLAVDRDIIQSVDKGRERITIRKKRSGITVKGFTYTA